MKLTTYSANNLPYRLGIVLDDQHVLDPQQILEEKLKRTVPSRAHEIAAALLPNDPISFLANGEYGRNAANEAITYAKEIELDSPAVYSLDDVKIGPPILRPNKIICVGLNYRDHIQEMKRDLPTYPVLFAKFSDTIIGPQDPAPLRSSLTQKLDYEGELAFVIGKHARKVKSEDAFDYIAGYTVVNDITARDMQKRTLQWLQGKTLEGSLPMGPWLVTKEDIADPHNLNITLKVNGEVRQKSNTENLVFTIQYLVEFLSNIITLEPGDVICTGTPGGVGEAQGLFLKDGDVVRVEIDGIGQIENRITEDDIE